MSSSNGSGGSTFKYNIDAYITFVRDNRLDAHIKIHVSGNSWGELKQNAISLAKEYAEEFNIDYIKIRGKLGQPENVTERFEDLFFQV